MMFLAHIPIHKLMIFLGQPDLKEYVHQLALQANINISICHFLIHLLKMVSYNTYPVLLTEAPLPEDPQIPYHLNMVQAKRRGLMAKEKMFKKKYKKYTKIVN